MPLPEQLVRSFVRPTAAGDVEFVYTDPYTWDRDTGGEEMQHSIPSGTTDGADGEYQGDSSLSPRTVSAKGRVITTGGYSDLQDSLDALYAAHPVGAAGKLRRKIVQGAAILSDRFLECRVAYRNRGPETGLWNATWEIGFRSGKPVYQDWTPQAAAPLNFATTGGAQAITPGGTEFTAPLFSLTVTSAGTVTITEAEKNRFLTLTVTPGTYLIDCAAQTVTKAGADALTAITAGGFFKIAPFATSITLLNSVSGMLSAATVQVRRCWAFAS